MRQAGLQMLKFGLVGLANTALGLAVILLAMYGFGWPPVLSNAVGYLAGLCLSYAFNSRWTFQQNTSMSSGARFFLAFGVSYATNLLVLLAALRLEVAPLIAQICAVVTYTVVFFALSKFYVFSARSEP